MASLSINPDECCANADDMIRRSWIKSRNSNRAKSYFLALFVFSSASLCFSSRYLSVRSEAGADVSKSRFYADANEFCHSYPDLIFRSYPEGTVSSENCYSIESNSTSNKVGQRAISIELPSVSSSVLRRCRENPYHAFYDCLWPLLHYLSTCVPLESANLYSLVISNDSDSLRFVNDDSWLEGALAAVTQGLSQRHIGIETLQVSSTEHPPATSSSPVCFSSVVRFRPDANWRPLRYNAKFISTTERNESMIPHPERIKAAGLKLFRKLATSSTVPLEEPGKKRRIIVYDRGDARRRRWTNGFDFAWKLNATLGDVYDVVYLWKMPTTFPEQVELHMDAVGLIAPHGASFANSLFMPPNAILLEIASRNCSNNSVMEEIDEKAEDGWTVWHAAKLDMNYVTVGCTIAKERGMAIKTDNEALLKITSALLRVKEEALGLAIDD